MRDKSNDRRSAKTGQFVLTSERGEKFSAVEGLKLSERMEWVVREASSGRFLSSEERRQRIRDVLRKK